MASEKVGSNVADASVDYDDFNYSSDEVDSCSDDFVIDDEVNESRVDEGEPDYPESYSEDAASSSDAVSVARDARMTTSVTRSAQRFATTAPTTGRDVVLLQAALDEIHAYIDSPVSNGKDTFGDRVARELEPYRDYFKDENDFQNVVNGTSDLTRQMLWTEEDFVEVDAVYSTLMFEDQIIDEENNPPAMIAAAPAPKAPAAPKAATAPVVRTSRPTVAAPKAAPISPVLEATSTPVVVDVVADVIPTPDPVATPVVVATPTPELETSGDIPSEFARYESYFANPADYETVHANPDALTAGMLSEPDMYETMYIVLHPEEFNSDEGAEPRSFVIELADTSDIPSHYNWVGTYFDNPNSRDWTQAAIPGDPDSERSAETVRTLMVLQKAAKTDPQAALRYIEIRDRLMAAPPYASSSDLLAVARGEIITFEALQDVRDLKEPSGPDYKKYEDALFAKGQGETVLAWREARATGATTSGQQDESVLAQEQNPADWSTIDWGTEDEAEMNRLAARIRVDRPVIVNHDLDWLDAEEEENAAVAAGAPKPK